MQSLQSLARQLTAPGVTSADADTICRAVRDLLSSLTPAAAAAVSSGSESVALPAGLALSPSLAAQCLLDGSRTRAFVRGAVAALAETQHRFPGTKLDVVYAGTGPLAPIALLALQLIDAAPFRFTFIDVNAESVRSVRSLLGALGVSPVECSFVCADATMYRHRAPVHLLLSETMQRSLKDEPFVAILRNFRSQLAPGGVVVPERVTLSLASIDAAAERARWSGAAGAPDVGDETVVLDVDSRSEWPAEPLTVVLDGGANARERWVALFTRLRVFGDSLLEAYASGLTTPEILWELSPLRDAVRLRVRYVTGPRPRLDVRRASA